MVWLLMAVVGLVASAACTSAGVASTAVDELRVAPPGPPWTHPDGTAVDTTTGMNLFSPQGCAGWESATMLHIPWPLDREVVRDARDTRQYVLDPQALFRDYGVTGSGIVDDLPTDAAFTGFHTGHHELWLAPSDQVEFAYLVDDTDVIRRLSRPNEDNEPLACG